MQKTLTKNSTQKTKVAQAERNRNIPAGKRQNQSVTAVRKKPTGSLIQILNYQYQDSDLEQFVY